MDFVAYLAELMGTPAAGLRITLAYYGWMIGPVVAGFALVIFALVKTFPRQRRREDLSGQERRAR
jgi:hypothetical protein